MIEHHLYAFKADCVWKLIVSRHTVCSKSLWSLRTTHKLSTIETKSVKKARNLWMNIQQVLRMFKILAQLLLQGRESKTRDISREVSWSKAHLFV